MVGEGKGQRARRADRAGLDARLAALVVDRRAECAEDGVEDRAAQRIGVGREQRLFFVLDAGAGGGLVLGLQIRDDADAVDVFGMDHMLGYQAVAGGVNRHFADVDRHAGACLGAALGQLNHLLLQEAAVALQVELVDAGDDVIGLAVDEARDRRGALAVDHRLAELEALPQQGVVDAVGGAVGLVVERDLVARAVDAVAVEGLGVVRHRQRRRLHHQVHRLAVDSLLLGDRQLDEVRLVARSRGGVVLERDQHVSGVVGQPADREAPPRVVRDGVFGDQTVGTDVDHVVGVVDVAGFAGVGLGRVDVEADRRARIGTGDHGAVDLGADVRVGKAQAERDAGCAVGKGAALGLGPGDDVAMGLQVGGLAGVDDCGAVHRDARLDRGIGHRHRHRKAAGTQILCGLGGHVGGGTGVGRHHHCGAALDQHIGADVDLGAGVGLRITQAEQRAGGLAAGVGHRSRIDADGAAAHQLHAALQRDTGRRGLEQHLDRQCGEVADQVLQRLDDEGVGQAVGAEQRGGVAVLGLRNQVDAAGAQFGIGTHDDLDIAVGHAHRQEVVHVRVVDVAGAEDDVAFTQFEYLVGRHRDVVGKDFEVAVDDGDVAIDDHLVHAQRAQRRGRQAIVAVQQQFAFVGQLQITLHRDQVVSKASVHRDALDTGEVLHHVVQRDLDRRPAAGNQRRGLLDDDVVVGQASRHGEQAVAVQRRRQQQPRVYGLQRIVVQPGDWPRRADAGRVLGRAGQAAEST